MNFEDLFFESFIYEEEESEIEWTISLNLTDLLFELFLFFAMFDLSCDD